METVYNRGNSIAYVYAKNYGRSIKKINELGARLKSDFPELKDEHISVEVFGGSKLDRIIYVFAKVESNSANYFEVKDSNFFL